MKDPKDIKLMAITDSPKLSTGFGNVANQLLHGFHEYGFDVYSFGTMDVNPDIKGDLPFIFIPCNPFDEMGHRTVSLHLVDVQPDVIFLLFDPGNVDIFVNIITKLQENNMLKRCPLVGYIPIEGFPIPYSTALTFAKFQDSGGQVVLYSPKSIELFNNQFSDFELEFVYHGVDHANFRRYDQNYRNYLRELVGFDKKFVVGSVGVNKRTKGFDSIIYTARCLKDLNKHHDFLFYLHTSRTPVMDGYNLEDLISNYDVGDIVMIKPEAEKERGGNIRGIRRENDELPDYILKPETNEDYRYNLTLMSYIDRLNLFDCYLDLSQVEGWGLPAFEAMKCGVPTFSVRDYSVREEIYHGGVYWIDSLPPRCWPTWHTGVKLVLADPLDVANNLLAFKDSDTKEWWSEIAQDTVSKFLWKESKDKMNEIIMRVVNNYDYTDDLSNM